MSTIGRPTKEYSDLDMGFSLNPLTLDISKKKNIEAIKASIRNLISTSHFERPFHPEIGANVYNMLFENASFLTTKVIERNVMDVINNFEPRASVEAVSAEFNDNNELRLMISFRVKNTNQSVSFDVLVSRSR
jgi:phage baseplate assembly protein W